MTLTGAEVGHAVAQAAERARAAGPSVFISVTGDDVLARRVAELETTSGDLPLRGLPVAVKDNIDVVGLPTTAGCPAYAYEPEASAPVVRALEAAGAVIIGKTNLDQFATGLAGVRSPYGTPPNVLAPDRVPGGSSSGSAVAVASGIVPVALGTDTAGSGRVPATLNGLVGLKLAPGRVSTDGVLPACRSLDCVSVFAPTVALAREVMAVLAEAAPGPGGGPLVVSPAPEPVRLGVPTGDELTRALAPPVRAAFVGLLDLARQSAGVELVEVDVEPFLEVGRLLYGGPWLAERYSAVGAFVDDHPGEVLPVTRQIILRGAEYTAVEVFEAQYRLAELARQLAPVWSAIDLLLVPGVPSVPTLAELEAEPVEANAALGRYTHFVNLLGLEAAAIAGPRCADGVPAGGVLVAPPDPDRGLLAVAERLHLPRG